MAPGKIYFFTASIIDSVPLLTNDAFKRIVIKGLFHLVREKEIELYGYLIMNDHLHLLYKGKEESNGAAEKSLLRFSAHHFKFTLQEASPAYLKRFEVPQKNGQYQFWSPEPLREEIKQPETLQEKLQFMHTKPLLEKRRLVQDPEDYLYSSAAFYKLEVDPFHILTDYRQKVEKS